MSQKFGIERLRQTRLANNRAAWMISEYINRTPCAITEEMIKTLHQESDLPETVCYRLLLDANCNLDTETSAADRLLSERYLRQALTPLDAASYRCDPYYAQINLPCCKRGDWELCEEEYAPYEAFVCRDITLLPDLTEIPHVGYFDKSFRFPAVCQQGREWMAVKPNEIETMHKAVETVSGRVVTFGLGLGYFAYMAARKASVREVTVVEKDLQVIQLFKEVILPQFDHPEKILIWQSDAYDFLENELPKAHFDYAFIDLWHDTLDGLPAYLRCCRNEPLAAQTHFLYWVEESLLSALRWQLFDPIVARAETVEQALTMLSDENLHALACRSAQFTKR